MTEKALAGFRRLKVGGYAFPMEDFNACYVQFLLKQSMLSSEMSVTLLPRDRLQIASSEKNLKNLSETHMNSYIIT